MNVLLYDELCVDLPDGFSTVENEEIKKHFNTSVDYGFMTEDRSAAVFFIKTDTALLNDQIENQIVTYQQNYSRMIPGFVLGEIRKNDHIGRNIALMTYKSNAPTKDIYNIFAITTINNKELLILCSCDMQDAIDYMYKFVKVLDSMKFQEDNN